MILRQSGVGGGSRQVDPDSYRANGVSVDANDAGGIVEHQGRRYAANGDVIASHHRWAVSDGYWPTLIGVLRSVFGYVKNCH